MINARSMLLQLQMKEGKILVKCVKPKFYLMRGENLWVIHEVLNIKTILTWGWIDSFSKFQFFENQCNLNCFTLINYEFHVKILCLMDVLIIINLQLDKAFFVSSQGAGHWFFFQLFKKNLHWVIVDLPSLRPLFEISDGCRPAQVMRAA